MKILFLHISDMHFEKNQDLDSLSAIRIANAVSPSVIGSVDKVFIFITGDIAHSGLYSQYIIGLHFINNLIKSLKEKVLGSKRIHVYTVPGNHDINYTTPLKTRKYYEDCLANNPDAEIPEFLSQQYYYLNGSFPNRYSLSNKNPLFRRDIISIDDYSIEINCLNSACFSLKESDDKGLHFLPGSVIEDLNAPTGANFAITLMHHSHQWFNDSCKAKLEQALLEKNTLIFCGHEHYLSNQAISYNGHNPAHVFGGGCLCDRGDWTNSEFYAVVFDTEANELTQYNYHLKNNIYVKELIQQHVIKPKISTYIPQPSSCDYFNQLMRDQHFLKDTPLNEYYVFPRLIRQAKDRDDTKEEISDFTQFLLRLDNERHAEIRGADTAGKTALLKMIYSYYLPTKCVLFCSIADISSGNRRRIIQNLFEDQYSTDPIEFAKFEQLDCENKMLLIDDLHLIHENHISSFLRGIENEFGYVIYTTDNELQLNIEMRIKESILKDSYVQFRLPRFNEKNRLELVNRIVRIKNPQLSGEEQLQLVRRITDVMNLQRRFIPFTPAIILQFIEYYSLYQIDAPQNDGAILGKVFESSITTALLPNLPKTITVEKAFTLLGKIAFNIHVTGTYPISINDIFGVIDAYCDEYGGTIDKMAFINGVVNSKILIQHKGSESYKFCNNNYLAYFVATDIVATTNTEVLLDCMKYCCFRINATVLMFVTYITSNPRIIDHLLLAAEDAASHWQEYSFNSSELAFLNVIPDDKKFLPPSEEDKSKESRKNAEIDELEQAEADISVINVYDFDVKDADLPGNQLMRAISLLTTIARCLPNFEHLLKKEQKRKLIEDLYYIPNKIFYAWAIEVEKSKENLVEFIINMSENEQTQKTFSRYQAERLLQLNAIELLLELYNTVANNAYRENTYDFLCTDDWFNAGKNTYAIERLSFLGRSRRIRQFIKYAELLKNDKLTPPAQLALSMTARKLLIKGELDSKHVNEIESKFLPGAQHNHVLYSRKGEEKKR